MTLTFKQIKNLATEAETVWWNKFAELPRHGGFMGLQAREATVDEQIQARLALLDQAALSIAGSYQTMVEEAESAETEELIEETLNGLLNTREMFFSVVENELGDGYGNLLQALSIDPLANGVLEWIGTHTDNDDDGYQVLARLVKMTCKRLADQLSQFEVAGCMDEFATEIKDHADIISADTYYTEEAPKAKVAPQTKMAPKTTTNNVAVNELDSLFMA